MDTQHPYNTIKLQRERIIVRLRRGPATRIELEREESVPDATARIHELRIQGFDIRTAFATVINPDSTATKVARYSLADRDEPQGDLFSGIRCAAS